MTHFAAYIKAGYSKGGAKESASRMLTKANVLSEILRLRDESNTPKTLTRQLIREKRAEIALGSHSDKQAKLAALRDEEKSQGWAEPEKIDITHDVKITWGRG